MEILVVVLAVIVVLALAAGAYVVVQRRRSKALREQFGPEYDRVLENSGSRREAESALADRKERRDRLELRPLDEATRERYRSEWLRLQGSFVDDPGGAVEQSDALVTALMRDRGYPLDDVDQRAADISVDHPRVVEHYRAARRVYDAHRNGTASTEDLRGATTSYRDLVEALLEDGGSGPTGPTGPTEAIGTSGGRHAAGRGGEDARETTAIPGADGAPGSARDGGRQ